MFVNHLCRYFYLVLCAKFLALCFACTLLDISLQETDFSLILASAKSSFVSTLRSINQSFIKKSLFSAYLPPPKVDNQFDTIDKKFFNPQM